MVVIECGTLIDGQSDEPYRGARVRVDDGEVVEAGPAESVSVPDGATVHDHGDAVVIPGLIDAHLHLSGARSMDPMTWTTEPDTLGAARATADLRSLIEAGFTAVRDVGSATGIGLKRAVDGGAVPGPEIFTSGPSISQTAGHGDSHMLPYEWITSGSGIATLADGPAECRKEARKRIREGVDLLKIMTTGGVLSEKDSPRQSQFTDEEISAMTEEAHRVDIPVASHAQGAPGIKSALRNGVDTIEHGFYLDEEAIELMQECGAVFVPTLAIMHQIVEHGEDHGVPEYGLEKAREAQTAHFEAVERAYEAGVPIALGTDFIGPELVPHGENVLEAELFVDAVGMNPMDAIRAGTSIAARTVPASDIGRVAAGYRGDLTVLERDPLTDITALRDVSAVYKAGERVVDDGETVA
ncbi:MAG: amidohydrolase family protein [Halodesulfurarchaeum sp.]